MSNKIQTWKFHPIENEIINILLSSENRGEILSVDLYRIVANKYQDFTRNDLNQILFRLEVEGYIFAVPIKKDVMKIEINKNAKFSEFIAKKIKQIFA